MDTTLQSLHSVEIGTQPTISTTPTTVMAQQALQNMESIDKILTIKDELVKEHSSLIRQIIVLHQSSNQDSSECQVLEKKRQDLWNKLLNLK